jgi:energy-coupling factor transporter ATP-binding protein EcfA2
MDSSTLDRLIAGEIEVVNGTLAAFGVDAGTRPAWTTVAGSSFIWYGLRLGRAQAVDGLTKRLTDVAARIGQYRRGFGLTGEWPVALRLSPFALEVPHPDPQPLAWQRARLKLPSLTMLAGRVYDGEGGRDDTVSLRQYPHVLIAGISGSGKSTLARMMLGSLAINTSPDDLQVVIVDMKRADVFALRGLPQVVRAVYEKEDAARAVRLVEHEMRRRIERGESEPKVLLAIDELFELVKLPGVMDSLSSIVSLGRSMGVHVLAATQHPRTEDIGGIVKANFGLRFVGQVAGARQAEVAANRAGTGAELLPGRGAFLRVEGATVRRLQAYLLDDAGTESLVDLAQRTYGAARAPGVFGGADAPVRTGAQSDAAAGERGDEELAPVRTSASTGVQFPLPRRAPTLEEAAAIRRLRAECGSQNDLVRAVYGSKSSDTNRWVREALAAVAEVPAVTSGPARILRMGVR